MKLAHIFSLRQTNLLFEAMTKKFDKVFVLSACMQAEPSYVIAHLLIVPETVPITRTITHLLTLRISVIHFDVMSKKTTDELPNKH